MTIYYSAHYKSQLGWLSLPQLPILPPPVTAKQRFFIPKKETKFFNS